MGKLIIGLKNPRNESNKLELVYQLKNNPLIEKWLIELRLFLSREDAILFPRFGGFASHNRQLPELIEEINKHIETVNASGRYDRIEPVDESGWTTETHNRIHQHFANMIGQTDDPSAVVVGSSDEIWDAVGNVNLITHEIETLLSPDPIGAIHTSFMNSRRQYVKAHKMEESDYDHFTLDWNWGDLVLHYCQLGKVWHEVFLDRDEVIPDNNINPLCRYDGSFDILFWHPLSSDKKKEFKEWLVNERGQDLNNKELALGYAVAGELLMPEALTNLDDKGRIDFLGNYLTFDFITLVEGSREFKKVIV